MWSTTRTGSRRERRQPVAPAAMIVAIPARCEAATIGRCLESVFAAADALDPSTPCLVTVAADCCTDGTAARARSVARDRRDLSVLEGDWGSAGGARGAAVDHALAMAALHHDDLDRLWIATTDADTVVPRSWLRDHHRYASEGYDAVAGVVELLDDHDRTPAISGRFLNHYRVDDHSHPHVHGANMGVRASAYVNAGGFLDLSVGEDHALWGALHDVGASRLAPTSLTVATSARVEGRARGGFADTLNLLLAGEQPPALARIER
ncbi:MAG: glycosyltransferase [Actinobacteria bacterium]|nr:glycosyltransferase [Actinomycetota bacterium]